MTPGIPCPDCGLCWSHTASCDALHDRLPTWMERTVPAQPPAPRSPDDPPPRIEERPHDE